MKHIYLNLKRFDVPKEYGGVNSLGTVKDWAGTIIDGVMEGLQNYSPSELDFTVFFPEAHILNAVESIGGKIIMHIGCQGVYREDISPDGNFGAFTSNRPAAFALAAGCDSVLIGHCEERNDKSGIIGEAGVTDSTTIMKTVDRILNKEIICAQKRGMRVLYCIGEKSEEQGCWQEVLGEQLDTGLRNVDRKRIVIGYEPVWSIGPGKKPADKDYIIKIARFIKEKTDGMEVVYGGGLKADNAAMLASIPEIDGGLIALTRFGGDVGFHPDEYLEIIRKYASELSSFHNNVNVGV